MGSGAPQQGAPQQSAPQQGAPQQEQPLAIYELDLLKPYREHLLAGCTGRGGGVSKPPYDELNVGLRVAIVVPSGL